MGERIGEPDPGVAKGQAEFRLRLRELMRWAGHRSLQQLEAGARRRGVTMPVSTANRALNADKLPTAEFVERFVAACGGDVRRWLAARDLLVDRDHPRVPPGPAAEVARRSDVCPYPGLAPFQADQARWYFGRDQAVAELLDRVAERVDTGSPLFVVGPSGAGKSSLLRAGFIPALAEGRLPGSLGWRHVLLTPTADPLGELAKHVAALVGADPTGLRDELARVPTRLADVLSTPPGSRVVIVVDQFEEVFTLATAEDGLDAFIAALCAGPPIVAVVGLRADFYGRCTAHAELVHALRRGHLLLGPMSAVELREVIERPAGAVDLTVEGGLVEVMLADLGAEDGHGGRRYEPGALPLLSHSLAATWRNREVDELTLAGYRTAGGIRGAVTRSAERAFHALGAEEQQVARDLLLRMIQLGDGAQDTRRRLGRDALVRGSADPAAAEAVLRALVDARLVTLDADTVVIAHEVLLRAWPRLQQWVDTDRARLLVRQRLTEAAEEWDRAGRHQSDLYRGPRLAAARQWADPADRDLPRVTRDFLTASLRRRDRQRRGVRGRRLLMGGLAAVLVSAAVVVVEARGDAIRQHHTAVAQVAAFEALALRAEDEELAAQLSLAAFRLAPTPETRASLISALVRPSPRQLSGADSTDAVRSTAFSPDGRVLAVGSQSRAIQLLDLTDPDHPGALPPLLGHEGDVRAVAFSPDGRWLASASADHHVMVWAVDDPRHPALVATLEEHTAAVHALAFNRSGTRLATGDLDGTAWIWDVRDMRSPRPTTSLPHDYDLYTVAFSPDDRFLVSGGRDQAVVLWDISPPGGPRRSAELLQHTGYVTSVVFAPDGGTLVTASTDATARLWDVRDPRDPRHLGALTGHSAPVQGLAFGPDGRSLATTSVDTTVRLWNVEDPGHPVLTAAPLSGHTDNVYAVAFSPDGHTVATGSHDRTVRLWETDVARITERICRQDRRITHAEWARYFPGVDYAAPCP
ncbi:MAG: WD40 repeat domain-containing protein [Saccharothrix sp.]|nr:WD40 repeat domain-containing protein [Saccharothrix sp.]